MVVAFGACSSSVASDAPTGDATDAAVADDVPSTPTDGAAVDARDEIDAFDGGTDGSTDADARALAPVTPGCFSGGVSPQLDLNGPKANWAWNDPHVLKVGGAYWMYASAVDSFQFPVRLYRLVSTDGATWTLDPPTPVLADAPSGRWDSGGMETPAVAYFGGKYHLFYTSYTVAVGQPGHDPLTYRFGHAVSDDGITFTRVGTTPTVEASGADAGATDEWFRYLVAEPAPVVRGNELSVYFTAVGIDAQLATTLQVIGVVRTRDGVTWSAPELALKPDQTLYPRGQDWLGYSTPNAAVIDGEMHLFFDVAHQPSGGAWRQLRVHHARSADGKTGWVHDATPILSAPFSDWAVEEVRSPHALVDGNDVRLYFAGHTLADGGGVSRFGVGMMTCAR